MAYLAQIPVLIFVSQRPPKALLAPAPFVHNAKAKKSGETPIATRFMETKFKGGFAETVVCVSQTQKMLKTAGATKKKLPERN
jgi:hypothetical protein